MCIKFCRTLIVLDPEDFNLNFFIIQVKVC